MKPKPQKEKKFTQRRTDFAEGGSTHMHGRGDRTITATPDAAGQQTEGQTSQKSKSNPKFVKGGSPRGMLNEQAADPAPAGHTAKTKAAALGGEARPASTGQCGT